MLKLQKIGKNFECKNCNYNTCNKYNYNKHLNTAKHKSTIVLQESTTQQNKKYYCEICDYYASNKSNLNKHYSTIKHKSTSKMQETTTKSCKVIDNNKNITEDLIKIIKDQQTQIAQLLINQQDSNNKFINFIQQNNHSSTTICGNNNNFNFNIFLNDKCKDAINMSEFINSIKVDLNELMFTKQNGIDKGIYNIIVNNINKLDLTKRPMHCSDIKRQTLYIKDDNIWEKDVEHIKTNKFIKDIQCKQLKTLQEWSKEKINSGKDEDQQEYIKVLKNTTNSFNDTKIKKNLCENIYIEKSNKIENK